MTDDQPFTAPQTDLHEAGYREPLPEAACSDPGCRDCKAATDDQAVPLPPDVQDAYDAWLDDSEHNVLLMTIGDKCWSGIAYAAAAAAFAAGRAQGAATERERIREGAHKVTDGPFGWYRIEADLLDGTP